MAVFELALLLRLQVLGAHRTCQQRSRQGSQTSFSARVSQPAKTG